MVDKIALAQFIADTVFVFAYDLAGAVIAFSVILRLILHFAGIFKRSKFL